MKPRVLVLQIRDLDDPMREQEVECFRRRLPGVPVEALSVLYGRVSGSDLDGFDAVMVGGSGRYSCVGNREDWFVAACRTFETVLERRMPLFASCWGIQALGSVLGVPVVHDVENREVGTFPVHLTVEGQEDPLFDGLPSSFPAQLGHQDRLASVPAGATLLAYSDRAPVQAFRLDGHPVYATQFHPELNRAENLERLVAYRYKYHLDDAAFEAMAAEFRESPHTEPLMQRFLRFHWPASGEGAVPGS